MLFEHSCPDPGREACPAVPCMPIANRSAELCGMPHDMRCAYWRCAASASTNASRMVEKAIAAARYQEVVCVVEC